MSAEGLGRGGSRGEGDPRVQGLGLQALPPFPGEDQLYNIDLETVGCYFYVQRQWFHSPWISQHGELLVVNMVRFFRQ